MDQNKNSHTFQVPEVTDDRFPLSEEVIGLLAEYRAQMDALGAQQRGMLMLFMRQHKLQGVWQVADNGREMIRRQESVGNTNGGTVQQQ